MPERDLNAEATVLKKAAERAIAHLGVLCGRRDIEQIVSAIMGPEWEYNLDQNIADGKWHVFPTRFTPETKDG